MNMKNLFGLLSLAARQYSLRWKYQRRAKAAKRSLTNLIIDHEREKHTLIESYNGQLQTVSQAAIQSDQRVRKELEAKEVQLKELQEELQTVQFNLRQREEELEVAKLVNEQLTAAQEAVIERERTRAVVEATKRASLQLAVGDDEGEEI